MRRGIRCQWAILSMLLFTTGFAMGQGPATDTLQMARDMSTEGKFAEAAGVLESFLANNPNNVYAKQLLANCYQWNGQYEQAEKQYLAAIEAHRDAHFLVLDYARMLFEQKRFREAEAQYKAYLETDANNVEARINLGYIRYWYGDYRDAEHQFDVVLGQYPDNPTALAMKEKLDAILRPYVKIGYQYANDTQPLTSNMGMLEAGWYKSAWFRPQLNVDYTVFSDTANTNTIPWVRLRNTMDVLKSGTKIMAELGVLPWPDGSRKQMSAVLEVSQAITSKWSATLRLESMPYFYSMPSAFTRVNYVGYTVTARWNDPDVAQIQTAFSRQFFAEDNVLSLFYLWGLSKDFGFEKVKFNVGASYSFFTSKNNLFLPSQPYDEIVANPPAGEIEGEYYPYFTPENQNILGVLGVVKLEPVTHLGLELKGNIGLISFSQIPYFYLDRLGNGNNGQLKVVRDYYTERKITLDLGAKLRYDLSKKWSVQAAYTYTENFFYSIHIANIHLRYRF